MDSPSRSSVRTVVKRDFRVLFGSDTSEKWGDFVDNHLSGKVNEFADWLDYPKGDRRLTVAHTQEVYAAVVSDEGRYLFTGSFDKTIAMWDLLCAHSRCLQQWTAHRRSINCLAYLDPFLISGSNDQSICLWDSRDDGYHLAKTITGHKSRVTDIIVDRVNKQMISSSQDRSIRVWSLTSERFGECIQIMMNHSDEVTSLSLIYSHSSSISIISGSYDKSMVIIDKDESQTKTVITHGNPYSINGRVTSVSNSMDGSNVACVTMDYVAVYHHEWPKQTLEESRRIVIPGSICCFHPNNPNLLAIDDRSDYSVRVFDVSDGKCIRIFKGHSSMIKDICFTPDGYRMITACNDRSSFIWDLSADLSCYF